MLKFCEWMGRGGVCLGRIYQNLKKRKFLFGKLRHNIKSLGESFSPLDEETSYVLDILFMEKNYYCSYARI